MKLLRTRIIRAVLGSRHLAAALAMTLLFPFYYVLPQSPLPPDEAVEAGEKETTIMLSQDALRLATDYLEILKQLETLTKDYGDYFDRLQKDVSKDERDQLDLIASKLKDGSYIENMKGVEEDIAALLKKLSEKEKELENRNERAFRLSLSLRQELAALKELLDQEVLLRMDENSDIVLQACALMVAGLSEPLSVPGKVYHIAEHGAIVIPTEIGDNKITKMVYVVPSTDELTVPKPETLSMPSRPQPSNAKGSRDREFLLRSGRRGIIREFADSLEVSSTKQPIYINNPIGDLEVQGWDVKRVQVRSSIELSANSHQKAKKQIQHVALQLYSKDDGI
ncbi:MAG: hypothetical protein ACE5K8_03225 [Candidatus Zixiibacteriota bacterium]